MHSHRREVIHMEIEKVREFFRNDRFATENGAVIDSLDEQSGEVRVSLTIDARHKNAMGAVMGGVYFTLADFAFAVATNYESAGVVSLSSDISFIGQPKGERLIAAARPVKKGRTVSCYSITVTDELGNITAEVKTVGLRVGGK